MKHNQAVPAEWICEECGCKYARIGDKIMCNTDSGDGWFETVVEAGACDCGENDENDENAPIY